MMSINYIYKISKHLVMVKNNKLQELVTLYIRKLEYKIVYLFNGTLYYRRNFKKYVVP